LAGTCSQTLTAYESLSFRQSTSGMTISYILVSHLALGFGMELRLHCLLYMLELALFPIKINVG